MKKQRVLSIVLALALALSLAPVGFAADYDATAYSKFQIFNLDPNNEYPCEVNLDWGTKYLGFNANGYHEFALTVPVNQPFAPPIDYEEHLACISWEDSSVVVPEQNNRAYHDASYYTGIAPGEAIIFYGINDGNSAALKAVAYVSVLSETDYAANGGTVVPWRNKPGRSESGTNTQQPEEPPTPTSTPVPNPGTTQENSAPSAVPGTNSTNTPNAAAIPMQPKEVPTKSTNYNDQDYSTGRWADTVDSYLYANGTGGLTRVESMGKEILVENYDSSFKLLSGCTIPKELPLWGGFYAGKDYNFFVFGQENREENDQKEVIQVVKYSKDWQRLGQASLCGANTIVPFAFGSLRCDEYGGYLYIRTCHQMYMSNDGLNHQCNMMLSLQESDMVITDAYYNVGFADSYVGHSFNQFILVNQVGKLIALDHGDAYPRGIAFTKYLSNIETGKFTAKGRNWCKQENILEFPGATGDNNTGASVGGLAETANGYAIAYNYDQKGSTNQRYAFFHYIDKQTGEGWSRRLTTIPTTTPVLAPLGPDGGYMLWMGKSTDYSTDGTLYYVRYGADGTLGQIQSVANAGISDCQPIPYNGKAVWYVTNNSTPVFYTLDVSGLTAIPTAAATSTPSGNQTGTDKPDPTQQPETSKPTFTDVPAGIWFEEAVTWAAEKNITNGYGGKSKFAPYQDCTNAQILTFLWRAADKPSTTAKAPVTVLSSYTDAVNWAYGKGMIDDSFQADAPCTRAQAVQYIWQAMDEPTAQPSSFTDVPAGASYARAVSWAVEKGVTNGYGSNTTFAPYRTCNRGEIAKFLFKAYH